MLAVASLLWSGTALAAGTTIYDNIPSPTPGNVASVGYEANGIRQFGDRVGFGASGPRLARETTVLMSSWACQSGHWTTGDCATTPGATFSHPITLTFYAVGPGNSVGTILGGTTQTFAIPYRPSASPSCIGPNAGKWSDGTTCYNGYATPITFDVSGLSLTLPNEVIVGVAYNTSHYGYVPIGTSTACYSTPAGCGYDSLNVGTAAAPPTTGINPAPTDAYLDSVFGSTYCDGGIGGTSVFRLDAGCWAGFKPALRVTASFAAPSTANDCKKGGWEDLSRADGSSFKNQGDCVSYTNNGK